MELKENDIKLQHKAAHCNSGNFTSHSCTAISIQGVLSLWELITCGHRHLLEHSALASSEISQSMPGLPAASLLTTRVEGGCI